MGSEFPLVLQFKKILLQFCWFAIFDLCCNMFHWRNWICTFINATDVKPWLWKEALGLSLRFCYCQLHNCNLLHLKAYAQCLLPKWVGNHFDWDWAKPGVGKLFTRRFRFGKTVEAAVRTLIEKQGEDLFFWRSRSTYECDLQNRRFSPRFLFQFCTVEANFFENHCHPWSLKEKKVFR